MRSDIYFNSAVKVLVDHEKEWSEIFKSNYREEEAAQANQNHETLKSYSADLSKFSDDLTEPEARKICKRIHAMVLKLKERNDRFVHVRDMTNKKMAVLQTYEDVRIILTKDQCHEN